MVGRLRTVTRRVWPGVLSVALALAAWTLASAYLVDPLLLPPPASVWHAAARMVASGQLLEAIAVSLTRIVVG
ncbi:MAG: ABC transporter permease, partial [Candidatus Rokuibacteriota bacterium]